jgi:hypothetical protein
MMSNQIQRSALGKYTVLLLAGGTGVLLGQSSEAQTSWESATDAVRAKGSAYYDYAISLDPMSRPGTALQGIGHDRHICAIVGRMLGFTSEIQEAETFEDPPMIPNADPYALMEHVLFLDSWVAAAERAIAMTESQKASLWNLECVGLHGIPSSAYLGDVVAGDFSVLHNSLVVYGNIDPGFFERFRDALDANPGVDTVALGSAGGSVFDAILSGLEIRRRGLATELHGNCYSACPLLFAGGVRRVIWQGPGPHLGFHQVFTSAGALPLDDPVYSDIAAYLSALGIDPRLPLAWMASAGPNEMYEPTLDELCISGITTWIQRFC